MPLCSPALRHSAAPPAPPGLTAGLANSAWALGRLRYAGPSRELPALIASAARAKLPEFNAQNIANTLCAAWSTPGVGVGWFTLVEPRARNVGRQAARGLAGTPPHTHPPARPPNPLPRCSWALVYMHHRSEPLLRAAAAAAAAKAPEFKPQELANLVWAYASMEYRDDAMLAALAGRAHALAEQVSVCGGGTGGERGEWCCSAPWVG